MNYRNYKPKLVKNVKELFNSADESVKKLKENGLNDVSDIYSDFLFDILKDDPEYKRLHKEFKQADEALQGKIYENIVLIEDNAQTALKEQGLDVSKWFE